VQQSIALVIAQSHLQSRVRIAVNFDHDLSSVLGEIENVSAERNLTVKMKSLSIEISQTLP